MNNLVINSETKQVLETEIASSSQSILLVGPKGIGKYALAKHLAEQVIGISDLTAYPYKLILSPNENSSISIESVRELEHFLALKVISKNQVNRVVIIDDANYLTIEAQNALLKTLEEPPLGTILILTSSNEKSLLPTVISRVKIIKIKKPSKDQLKKAFMKIDLSDFNKWYTMSSGLPGFFVALVENKEHPLVNGAITARKILTSSTVERLSLVDELSKNKNALSKCLTMLEQMAQFSLENNHTGSLKWLKVLSASYEANEQLSQNVNVKLLLTNLMLKI